MQFQKQTFRRFVSLVFLVSIGLVYLVLMGESSLGKAPIGRATLETTDNKNSLGRLTDSFDMMSGNDNRVTDLNLFKLVTLQLYPVASRYPATPEYMSLEDAVYFHISSALSPQRIETVSVETQRDKTELHVMQLDSPVRGADNDREVDNEPMRPPDFSPTDGNTSDQVGRLIVTFLVSGKYYPPPEIDYESLLMDALEETGNINIIKQLLSGRASHYFRRLSTVECLDIVDAPESGEYGGDDGGPQFVSAAEDFEPDTEEDVELNEAEVEKSDENIEMDEVNKKDDKDINIPSSDGSGIQNNETPKHNRDATTTYSLPKNSGAMYSRFVTSCILIAMCSVIALWNIVRLAAKRYKARKRRIALAKEAFRAPYAITGGKTTESEYDTAFRISMNNKYAGAMDKDHAGGKLNVPSH